MWGRSHERPPAHTVTTSDDLLQQQQLCLIGVSTPNRRDGSCDDLGPNPNSPTKQGHSEVSLIRDQKSSGAKSFR